ncbi:MAG: (d)CMP kinase [Lachnospiraceae bacterium]|nr:(d)CMP kinase [Ruminococcus sp.]MCM1276086.1 (d)CMP kinase [Lachnospiraceae bacterium]
MISVAIDGPVGAGKSTIARAAAERLNFIYCDTGALYRAVGLYCHRNGVNMREPSEVAAAMSAIDPEIRLENGVQRIFLNGEDVSEEIRLPEISMAANAVSAVPEVRAALLDLQRGIAEKNSVIMDGRDIGTVVLPNADVKIFLTAKPEIRAKRRYDELAAKGADVTFEEVLSDLNKRDYNDSHRAAAPLRQAPDAVLADTSELDFGQSVDLVCGLIKERL